MCVVLLVAVAAGANVEVTGAYTCGGDEGKVTVTDPTDVNIAACTIGSLIFTGNMTAATRISIGEQSTINSLEFKNILADNGTIADVRDTTCKLITLENVRAKGAEFTFDNIEFTEKGTSVYLKDTLMTNGTVFALRNSKFAFVRKGVARPVILLRTEWESGAECLLDALTIDIGSDYGAAPSDCIYVSNGAFRDARFAFLNGNCKTDGTGTGQIDHSRGVYFDSSSFEGAIVDVIDSEITTTGDDEGYPLFFDQSVVDVSTRITVNGSSLVSGADDEARGIMFAGGKLSGSLAIVDSTVSANGKDSPQARALYATTIEFKDATPSDLNIHIANTKLKSTLGCIRFSPSSCPQCNITVDSAAFACHSGNAYGPLYPKSWNAPAPSIISRCATSGTVVGSGTDMELPNAVNVACGECAIGLDCDRDNTLNVSGSYPGKCDCQCNRTAFVVLDPATCEILSEWVVTPTETGTGSLVASTTETDDPTTSATLLATPSETDSTSASLSLTLTPPKTPTFTHSRTATYVPPRERFVPSVFGQSEKDAVSQSADAAAVTALLSNPSVAVVAARSGAIMALFECEVNPTLTEPSWSQYPLRQPFGDDGPMAMYRGAAVLNLVLVAAGCGLLVAVQTAFPTAHYVPRFGSKILNAVGMMLIQPLTYGGALLLFNDTGNALWRAIGGVSVLCTVAGLGLAQYVVRRRGPIWHAFASDEMGRLEALITADGEWVLLRKSAVRMSVEAGGDVAASADVDESEFYNLRMGRLHEDYRNSVFYLSVEGGVSALTGFLSGIYPESSGGCRALGIMCCVVFVVHCGVYLRHRYHCVALKRFLTSLIHVDLSVMAAVAAASLFMDAPSDAMVSLLAYCAVAAGYLATVAQVADIVSELYEMWQDRGRNIKDVGAADPGPLSQAMNPLLDELSEEESIEEIAPDEASELTAEWVEESEEELDHL